MCGKRYRLAECCKVDIGIKYTYWLDFKDKNEGEKRRVERIWGGGMRGRKGGLNSFYKLTVIYL